MKVILLGSFAGNNAGDMVVLESIVHDFNNYILNDIKNADFSIFNGIDRNRNLKLVILTLNNQGVEYIKRVTANRICMEIIPIPIDKNPIHLLKVIQHLIKEFKSADYVYTTAGMLFDQKIWNPLYNFVTAYTPLLLYAKYANPDVQIIGYNVGITSKSRTIGKLFLKKCVCIHNRIYLREKRDAVLLEKLQYKGSIFVSADNVFGYHEPMLSPPMTGKKKKMYINLTLYGVKKTKFFLHEMIDFINIMKQTYDIYFFQTSARDLQLAKTVCQKARLNECHIYYLGLMGYAKIQELLAECHILVGMRMHSIIFALKRCCPVIAICYSSKVLSLMKTMHLKKSIVALNELTTANLVEKADAIERQREHVISQIYHETKKLYFSCNRYK